MKKSRFHCEDPDHEGDRIVYSPYEQVVVSEDHMSSDGRTRRHRIHVTNLCSTCSDRREHQLRPKGPESERLFS